MFQLSRCLKPIYVPTNMIYLILAAILAVIIFHIFVFHQYNFPWTAKLINKIPGPTGVFYFGSTMRFWNMKNEDRMDDIFSMFEEYGSTFRYWFSGVPVVFISELSDYQTVLGSRENSSKGILYKHILHWLGRGLLTSSGHKWHTRRKIITPAFHFSILQGFVEIFNRNANIMINRLKQAANCPNLDLCSYVTCCTLDNVCETAMGTTLNSQSGEPTRYVDGVFRMGSIVAERMFSPVLFPDVNFSLTSLGREHHSILKYLHGFTENVIRDSKAAKKMHNTFNEKNKFGENGIYRKKLTFLQLLQENQQQYKLSDKDIREEVDTFMFEGHDTTSMGITWTLFELGCHPEIQRKCFEEQLSIFEDSDRMPTYQEVMEMHYLKRVVQESLRLHPSVPVISRKFDVDMQLKDYLIPAGTEIVMCLYHLHRNRNIYSDPSTFDPGRFLPDAVEARHRYAYLPFSAGLRNCVGQKFATLELLLILSSVIRSFEIETLDKRESVKPVPEMTLRPCKPIHWKITPRILIKKS